MKKIVRLALGVVIASFFIWLMFRNLSFAELKTAFSEAELSLVMMAILAFLVGYSCRIERWRLMLMQENHALRWQDCAGPLMASVAANNILPFRGGDLLRAFGFNRRLGISAATSLATLFVERLLDLLMVVLFFGLTLAYFGTDSSRFVGVGGGALILAGAAILLLLMLPSLFKPMVFGLCRLLSQYLPTLGERIYLEFQKVFTALAHTSKGQTMLRLVFWSLLAWMAEGFVFWLLALALPSIANDLAAWLALPVGTLATAIPSTPGYVGTFDYFTAQAMIALGNTSSGAIAFALMVHAVLWLPPLILGGLYLLVNPLKQQN